MQNVLSRKRVLILVVAYNAERTIEAVIRRIPSCLAEYDTEILIVDDSSQDKTFEKASALEVGYASRLPLTVLSNPVNQGYGGNQKVGFHYAIRQKFDIVALLHGDGQYAPERLPDLLHPLIQNEVDAVFGSRMMYGLDALRGGMPLYKFIGNKILTKLQNHLLKSSLSEFHSGYRLYSVKALERVPFDRNTNGFHFDTEIIIQFLRAGLRIRELPIPTYYGDEICRVNGLKYALNVIKATILSRTQDLGILYERKFDVSRTMESNPFYTAKFNFESSHSLTLECLRPGSSVLDIGCSYGYISRAIKDKGCFVTGLDRLPAPTGVPFDRFIKHDLDSSELPADIGEHDYVLLLDVVEHLRSPEAFVDILRRSWRGNEEPVIIFSTPNIAFIVSRLMLLFGFFNYGARGILDLTHTRLFTFSTARELFLQAGYRIEQVRGVPAPFPLAVGDNLLSRVLLTANKVLIRLARSLFSYQIFMVVRPLPSLEWLLARAFEKREERIGESC